VENAVRAPFLIFLTLILWLFAAFFDSDKMQQDSLSKRNKFYRISSVHMPYFYNLFFLFCRLLDWWRNYNHSLFPVNIWRGMNHGAWRIFF